MIRAPHMPHYPGIPHCPKSNLNINRKADTTSGMEQVQRYMSGFWTRCRSTKTGYTLLQRIYISDRRDSTGHRLTKMWLTQPLPACSGRRSGSWVHCRRWPVLSLLSLIYILCSIASALAVTGSFFSKILTIFETVYVLSICIYAELYSILSCDSSLIKQLLVKNGKFAWVRMQVRFKSFSERWQEEEGVEGWCNFSVCTDENPQGKECCNLDNYEEL